MGEGCDGRVMRWAPSPNKVTSSEAFSLEAKHKTAGWGLGVYYLPAVSLCGVAALGARASKRVQELDDGGLT